MERFLRYSLERECSIRTVFLWKGSMAQKTVRVLALDHDTVTLRAGAQKPITIPAADVLSCDYARGDRGED